MGAAHTVLYSDVVESTHNKTSRITETPQGGASISMEVQLRDQIEIQKLTIGYALGTHEIGAAVLAATDELLVLGSTEQNKSSKTSVWSTLPVEPGQVRFNLGRLRGHDVLVPDFPSFPQQRESRFSGRKRFRDKF